MSIKMTESEHLRRLALKSLITRVSANQKRRKDYVYAQHLLELIVLTPYEEEALADLREFHFIRREENKRE